MSTTPNSTTPPEGDWAIPPEPPAAMRAGYNRLSRAYIFWCVGMLVWAGLCVIYFILTGQGLEMSIALCLAVVALLMIALPTVLFGGETWHKRLGWITVLLSLFSVMFVYPLIAVILGIHRRIDLKRYPPDRNDSWHLVLCAATLLIYAFTLWNAFRAGRMVRKLARGDFSTIQVKAGPPEKSRQK